MIEVKDLVKSYGGHMAVDHLSFTVRDGQIYGFLGPNGAGKSTTMNIMTGYLGATSGEVLINGHNILEEPEAAKSGIGYLPEIPPLYTDMTVREYLDFAASLKKIPRASRAEAVAEVMELVKVADVSGRLIKNLSKGYRQRVGMAQAILGKPQVIILDEPTVGLDPKQIIEIRDMIRGLGKKHTVILSSHILSEVSAVCDHILIINRGKLIASDTPENLERQMAGAGGMNRAADFRYPFSGIRRGGRLPGIPGLRRGGKRGGGGGLRGNVPFRQTVPFRHPIPLLRRPGGRILRLRGPQASHSRHGAGSRLPGGSIPGADRGRKTDKTGGLRT